MPSKQIYTERFNKHKLYYIITHKERYRHKLSKDDNDDNGVDPFNQCEKYLNESKRGVVEVVYHQRNGRGRFFADYSLSMSSMKREIRHTIADGYYVDVDMVNAHPVILEFICNNEEIKCPELTYYINNREKCLKLKNINRDIMKNNYLSIINGGGHDKSIKQLNKFAKEITRIHNELCSKKSTQYDEHVVYSKSKKRTKNFKGSFINILMCNLENEILQTMLEYFGKPTDAVLCFDGVMLPKYDENGNENKYNLRGCSTYIKNTIGIKMKLKIKPMDKKLTVDDDAFYNEVVIDDVIPFDRNDNYTWNDFEREYKKNYLFDSRLSMYNEILPKLKKILARVSDGDGYYVKKVNTCRKLFNITSLGSKMSVSFKVVGERKAIKIEDIVDEFPNVFKYRDIIVEPNSVNRNINGNLNIWVGFKAQDLELKEPVDEKLIDPILDLIKNVWASGDVKIYEGLLYFFAHIVQKPGERGLRNILLVGGQGTGKSFVIDFLSEYVFGEHLVSSMVGIRKATQKHNEHLQGKKLYVVNEMASTRDEFRSNFDTLKGLTDRVLDIEPKNKNSYEVKNIGSWIFLSNHDDTMYLERDDRRNVCLRVSDIYKQNEDHFISVRRKCFNDTCGRHFYKYLMSLNMDELNSICKIKNTPLKTEMINISLPSHLLFMKEICEHRDYVNENKNNVDDEKNSEDEKTDNDDGYNETKLPEKHPLDFALADTILARVLYNKYQKWCSDNGRKTVYSDKFFKGIKCEKKRANKGWKYNLSTYKLPV